MADFDAELYLRMLGERQLLSGEDEHHFEGPLRAPAGALVIAGAIDPARAARVIDDYASAEGLRSDHGAFRARRAGRPRPRRTPRLGPRRTVILDQEIAFGAGRLRLRFLTLGGGGGRRRRAGALRFHWARDPDTSRPTRRSMRMMGGGGPFPWDGGAPTIVDDHGRALTVDSGSGGGNETEWDGTLELSGPLSASTSWLEIDGHRIALREAPPAREVVIEPRTDGDGVARYLWSRLAAGELHFHRNVDPEPVIAALVAAGALDPAGEIVGQVRAVAARLPDHPRHPGGPASAGARPVPEPWRSLLRRVGRHDGPERAIVIGALTPVFDGVQVALQALISDADGYEVEFEVAPNVLSETALGTPPFAWWARDDRGNHYLGAPTSWGGGDQGASGTLRFWPALDPTATRIDFLPTAATARAVVAVPLGEAEQTRA